ncbi:hypothetical protein EJ06DRAFT_285260 [Trichodelitschia bisporula]|uniref:Uncharacterized protein n=1 Tax=Trichodelitschia bisporula TaxID=703511 RepID=A0A6G1I609_9PEZI|nr:hypothetical protein EJ06DRAFT_285260 [Trichodelitschia bisporula]
MRGRTTTRLNRCSFHVGQAPPSGQHPGPIIEPLQQSGTGHLWRWLESQFTQHPSGREIKHIANRPRSWPVGSGASDQEPEAGERTFGASQMLPRAPGSCWGRVRKSLVLQGASELGRASGSALPPTRASIIDRAESRAACRWAMSTWSPTKRDIHRSFVEAPPRQTPCPSFKPSPNKPAAWKGPPAVARSWAASHRDGAKEAKLARAG